MFTISYFFASLMFAAGAANAQITIGPGQSQTITCSTAGGGGASTADCIAQLQNHCIFNTGRGREQCFTDATQYCPSTVYADCIAQTQNHCIFNTGRGREQCFTDALQVCRGNHLAIRDLMDRAVNQARIQERAIRAQSAKSE